MQKVKGESFKCLLRLHYKHKTTYGTANCSLNSINSYAGSAEDTIVNISITVINAIGKKESSRCSIGNFQSFIIVSIIIILFIPQILGEMIPWSIAT